MNADILIRLFLQLEPLKQLHRTGWVIKGVELAGGETVASHLWGTSFISLVIGELLLEEGVSLDLGRLISLALLHDMSEVKISDIPYSAVVLGGAQLAGAKAKAEAAAAFEILSDLGPLRKRLTRLWSEIDSEDTFESRIVRLADKLDMLVHAVALERSGVSPEPLHEFFISTRDFFVATDLKQIRDIYNSLLRMHLAIAETRGLELEPSIDEIV